MTRRTLLLAGIPAAWAAAADPPTRRAKPLPAVGEFVRYIDPTTESLIVRLTNPANASYLPAEANRFVSVRERFLIFSSDRAGPLIPYSVDLKTGLMRPLAVTDHLLPQSLCLDASGRAAYLIDGTTLKQVNLGSRKTEVLSEEISAFSLGLSGAELIVVRESRLYHLHSGSILAERVSPWCAWRPDGKGCAFGRVSDHPEEQEFWYLPLPASSGVRPTLLAQGKISNPVWSPDGRSLLFLRRLPGKAAVVTEIHEAFPEAGLEQRVAPTSQFSAFAPNGDGSVFVGASASKAQPTIVLLLRSVQRELTLCEHHAKDPASVRPVFSPDSRRVYFQSDHQGKSALYSVNVEALVEPTVPSAF